MTSGCYSLLYLLVRALFAEVRAPGGTSTKIGAQSCRKAEAPRRDPVLEPSLSRCLAADQEKDKSLGVLADAVLSGRRGYLMGSWVWLLYCWLPLYVRRPQTWHALIYYSL